MNHNFDYTNYQIFCEAARPALERETNRLLQCGFEQLASVEGRWHPNGFVVFHLNDHHELGNLRLHIWPEKSRVTRPDGAPIHTHAWHLCSRILSGSYTETLYLETDSGSVGGDLYSTATINYLEDNNSVMNPGTSWLKPTEKIEATGGEYHEVAAGIPHETCVSSRQFTATLLITSPPIFDKVKVYSPEQIYPSTYKRPILTHEQKIKLLNQLGHQADLYTEGHHA